VLAVVVLPLVVEVGLGLAGVVFVGAAVFALDESAGVAAALGAGVVAGAGAVATGVAERRGCDFSDRPLPESTA